MKVKKEYIDLAPAKIWDLIVDHINTNGKFFSVTGIEYKSKVLGLGGDQQIHFIGGSGGIRGTEGETIGKYKFINAYKEVCNDEISTASVESYIKRQQTPFVGLLSSAGIIE